MKFDYTITNEPITDNRKAYIGIDPKGQRMRFSQGFLDEIDLSTFTMHYNESEDVLGVQKEPDGKAFIVGSKGYVKARQLFNNVPRFQDLKTHRRYYFYKSTDDMYLFKGEAS